jgi:hypothetical protein
MHTLLLSFVTNLFQKNDEDGFPESIKLTVVESGPMHPSQAQRGDNPPFPQ